MVDFQHDRLLFSDKADRGGAIIGSGAAPTGTQAPSKRYTGDQPHGTIIAAPCGLPVRHGRGLSPGVGKPHVDASCQHRVLYLD